MNLNLVEQAKQRILSINWKSDDEKEGSHRLLFSEFLRRAALIAEVVDILDTPRTGWPLLDYAVFFDASLELEDEETEALARELHVKGHPSWYAWSVCVYFIHWVAIQEHPTVMHHQLLNPYEPLVMLYERGGYFRRDKIGTWEFASTAYFIGSASSHLSATPVADLKDEASLNRADEAFKD